MSVSFSLKKEGVTDVVMIPGLEVSGHILVKLIADKLGLKQQDLLVTNPITGQKLGSLQMIKNKYTVNVEKIIKIDQQSLQGIITNEQFQQMSNKARFFMIKSSNQENIQKARDNSVWATTMANQDRLRSAFLYTPHVFLLFATNRSQQVKGLARMENQPSKIPQKAFWTGVSNIRLGGNFELRWIRKKPLTSLQIQKSLGTQIRDKIIRISDGEQIQADFAKKIISIFQIPTQPYYQIKKQVKSNAEQQAAKTLHLNDILGMRDIPIGVPIFSRMIAPVAKISPNPSIVKEKKKKIKKKDKGKEKKKQKGKKKKKNKERKRSYSSSSQSSSSSQNSSSSSSSSSSPSAKSSSSQKSSQSLSSARKNKKIKKERRYKREKSEKRKRKERKHEKKRKSEKKEKKKYRRE